MKKVMIASYVIGIGLGVFMFWVFSSYTLFVENMSSEVLKYAFIDSDPSQLLVFCLFFMGFLFIISAFFTNFYTKRPDDRAPLYFSLYCWSVILSMVVAIFPYGNGILLVKLNYILNYISILIIHLYIHVFLGQSANRLLTYLVWGMTGLFIGLMLFGSLSLLSKCIVVFVVFSLLYFTYLCILSFRQMVKYRTILHVGHFISLLILTACLFHYHLVVIEWVDGDSLKVAGLFVFFMVHSALLTERFLQAYSETVMMKQVLQEKVNERTRELETANAEMKRMETERRELIANVCHDLASPIMSISLVLKGMIDEKIPVTEKQFLVESLHQSHLVEKLLQDLRQLNLLESNEFQFQMEEMEWTSFMQMMFQRYRGNVEIEKIAYKLVNETAATGQVMVKIDPFRMEQVYLNLISNCVKYTPVGGEIEVRVAVDERKQQAILVVTDNGVGIESDRLSLIYDRFYRTKPIRVEKESTGLGLHIVQSIVTKHQGQIQIESEKEVGTIVTITLPLCKQEGDKDGLSHINETISV